MYTVRIQVWKRAWEPLEGVHSFTLRVKREKVRTRAIQPIQKLTSTNNKPETPNPCPKHQLPQSIESTPDRGDQGSKGTSLLKAKN